MRQWGDGVRTEERGGMRQWGGRHYGEKGGEAVGREVRQREVGT